MSDDGEDRFRRRAEQFFYRVGYAITTWAEVDRALFDLCRFALNASNEKTAVVFYRSPQIGDHLILVDQLMKESVSERRFGDWKSIYKRLDALLKFRNDIAHNPAVDTAELLAVMGGGREIPVASQAADTDDDEEAVRPESWWSIRTEPMKLLRKSRHVEVKQADLIQHIRDVDQALADLYEMTHGLPKRLLRRSPAPARLKAPQGSGPRPGSDPRTRARRKSPPGSSRA